MTCADEEPTSGAGRATRERRRASQRIKLSRELMVRLQVALGNGRRQVQVQQQQPDQVVSARRPAEPLPASTATSAAAASQSEGNRAIGFNYAPDSSQSASEPDQAGGAGNSASPERAKSSPSPSSSSSLSATFVDDAHQGEPARQPAARLERCAPLNTCSIGLPAGGASAPRFRGGDERQVRQKQRHWSYEPPRSLVAMSSIESPERHLNGKRQNDNNSNEDQRRLGQTGGGHHKSSRTLSSRRTATVSDRHRNQLKKSHRRAQQQQREQQLLLLQLQLRSRLRRRRRRRRLACCKKLSAAGFSRSRSLVLRLRCWRRRLRHLRPPTSASRRLPRGGGKFALPRQNGFHKSQRLYQRPPVIPRPFKGYRRQLSRTNLDLLNPDHRASRSSSLIGHYSVCRQQRQNCCSAGSRLVLFSCRRARCNHCAHNWVSSRKNWPTKEQDNAEQDKSTTTTCWSDRIHRLPTTGERCCQAKGLAACQATRQERFKVEEKLCLASKSTCKQHQQPVTTCVDHDKLEASNGLGERVGFRLEAANIDIRNEKLIKEKKKKTKEKPSVILEPPSKRIPRSPANNLAGRQVAANLSAGSEHVLCSARVKQVACSQLTKLDYSAAGTNSSSGKPDDCTRTSARRRTKRKARQKRRPTTKTTTTTRCDREPLGWLDCRQLRQVAASLGGGNHLKGRPTCWRALVWALLCALLLVLVQPIGQVGRASGLLHQQAPASDEFRDTVLATMSTQSPGNMADPPLGPSAASGMMNSSTGASNLFDSTLAPTGFGSGSGSQQNQFTEQSDLLERLLTFCRIFVMGAIIVGDICGNSLVILSVCRHSKLRVTTNWFVVSLACADILVALFAMTFNASVIVSGRWLFKPWVCDFWNSCDVLASTASILHLCCISIDRYIAITRPLDYPMKITTRRVVYALCGVWISSALLSCIPIFTGVYTTAEHIKWLEENPDQCDFVVNRVYAVVSSSISFWIPSSIMVFTYWRIYKEATRQEKFIYKAQSMMPAPMSNHHSHHHSSGAARSKQRRSKSMAFASSGGGAAHSSSNEARIRQLARQQHELQPASKPPQPSSNNTLLPADSGAIATTELTSQPVSAISERASSLLQLAETNQAVPGGGAGESEPLRASGPLKPADLSKNNQNNSASGKQQVAKVAPPPGKRRPPSKGAKAAAFDEQDDEDDDEDSNSGQSTPTKRSISKMKREHKAAKTLGIIMGVFILCWLPFFSWYTPQHLCGQACGEIVPRGAVTILFWIGYFNSTLNPIIYAYFNHEFRDAFKKTLQWIFCCCNDLKCLRVNRPNDNQHYNCTYRSTQEIGLVSNS